MEARAKQSVYALLHCGNFYIYLTTIICGRPVSNVNILSKTTASFATAEGRRKKLVLIMWDTNFFVELVRIVGLKESMKEKPLVLLGCGEQST